MLVLRRQLWTLGCWPACRTFRPVRSQKKDVTHKTAHMTLSVLTDIHDAALSSTGDDTLERASRGEVQAETVMIFGVHDGHIPLAGRTLIRERLSNAQPAFPFSFLELQANHAFIRDEMSKVSGTNWITGPNAIFFNADRLTAGFIGSI